jgi:RHS repeat-associated protein
VDQLGNRTTFTYDSDHYLLDINDPLGNRASRADYDADGRLVAVTDAKGRRTEFNRNLDSQVEISTDALGNTTTTRYDDFGNVLSIEQPFTSEGVAMVAVTTFEYDAAGNRTLTVDPDGVTTQAAFDDKKNVLQSVVDPGGLEITRSYTYDANGDRTSTTWPTGEVLNYAYDGSGNPTELVDPSGAKTTLEYNASGRATRREDPTGGIAEMGYDGEGRLTSETIKDADGNVLRQTSATYDNNGNKLTQTVLRNGATVTTSWQYDALNRKTAETDPLGNTRRWEYNALGRISATVDKLGRRIEFEYDEVGDITKKTYADGTFETWEYDVVGNIVARTDRAGNRTRFEYDELRRRVGTILPDDREVRTVYTPGGRVAATIDTNGARTDYEYDASGRRTKVISPLVFDAETGADVRPEIAYEYDACCSEKAIVDPRGNRMEFDNDFETRTFKIFYPDGTERTRLMDAGMRVVGAIDEDGNLTEAEYDPLGQLLSVTLPPPKAGDPRPRYTYEYDESGNLISQTDALGRTTAFEYDGFNRMTKKILPGGQEQSFAYDAAGNIVGITDFDGQTTSYEYDVLDRMVKKTAPDGTFATLTYDDYGQLSTVTDSRGLTRYSYDALGRMIGLTQPGIGSIDYSHDSFGRLVQTGTTDSTIDYSYDDQNRLTGVSGPAGTAGFGYDAAGNPVRIQYPNGVMAWIHYDNRNRAVGIEHTASDDTELAVYDYTRTASGRVSQIRELDGSQEDYTYDAIGRLIGETRTGANPFSRIHEYDLVGNRTRLVADGVETLYSYDINDRLLTAGTINFAYDSRGNRTSRDAGGGAVATYDWDFNNRLKRVETPSGSVIDYEYDFVGRRVAKTVDGNAVDYLVDVYNPTGLPQVLEEHDGSGLLASYTYGLDLIAMTRGAANSYYHADLHGSTRLLTNDAEAITDGYSYDGYGELTALAGSTQNNYLYSGEQFDPDSALYYLRARYYDPSVARFISRDGFPGSLVDPLSQHPYLYAHADPVNGIDPTGNFTLIGLSMGQVIQGVLRAINIGKKAYQLCKLKDKLQKFEFLMGFLRTLYAGFKALNSAIGGEAGWTGYSGTTVTVVAYKYEASDHFRLGDGIKMAEYKELAKYGADIPPAGGPEPWFEVAAKTFKNPATRKIEGAVSSWTRFRATAAIAGGIEEELVWYYTCGIKSMTLAVGASLSVSPYGSSSGSLQVGGKVYIKAIFFGGLADFQFNIFELKNP